MAFIGFKPALAALTIRLWLADQLAGRFDDPLNR
jgi:hypothetical protein